MTIEPRRRFRGENQEGSDGGQQGPPSRKHSVVSEKKQGRADQQQPGQRAGTGIPWKVLRLVKDQIRQYPSDHQLPEAGKGGEKRRDRIFARRPALYRNT